MRRRRIHSAQIAAIAPADPAKKLRMMFLYVRGQSGVYYLFGEESGADSLIDALGGIDVAAVRAAAVRRGALTPEAAEAFAAFKEKRKPVFHSR